MKGNPQGRVHLKIRCKSLQKQLVVFLLALSSLTVVGQSQSAKLYEVVASESAEEVLGYLTKLETPSSTKESAQRGVLLMRSAEYEALPTDKLSSFKEGRDLLEAAINQEPENVEFRFFRLLIQENAPRMLRYNENIEGDTASILASFGGLSKELKNAILAYSKTSKALNSEDLE